jgi:hypothetical protein
VRGSEPVKSPQMNSPPASAPTVAASTASIARAATTADPSTDPRADARKIRNGRIKLLLLFLLFASPVIASYFTYYVIQPSGRTNYGELIEPQRSVLATDVALASGERFEWKQLRGKWVMLTAYDDNDEVALRQRLYSIRQVRLTTGKDMDRIERVLVLKSSSSPTAELLAQHAGLWVLRVSAEQWQNIWAQPADRILMVDPLGNLMMRFPARADPNKMKKDVSRLLRASRVG